jgi:nitrate/nitrite-specific signal transduction histidine kinase
VAIRLTALLGVLALLVGGCGGKSEATMTKAEYVKQMKAVGVGLGKTLNQFATQSDPKKAGAALATAQSGLRDAAKQLEDMKPPENVQTQHAKLVAAVNEFADELDPIIQKLQNGNASAAQLVLATKGFTAIQSASTAIAKAGYPILSG